MSKLVFLDLETGGLNPAQHPIVQVSAIAVMSEPGLPEVGELATLVQFDEAACDAEALARNSYDRDRWSRAAVPPAAARQQLSAFLREHATVPMVSKAGKPYKVARIVGHNVAFDLSFLRAWYVAEFLPAAFIALDTLQLAAWAQHALRADLPAKDLKLGTLAEALGIERGGELHDAATDCRLALEVARRLQPLVARAAGGGWR